MKDPLLIQAIREHVNLAIARGALFANGLGSLALIGLLAIAFATGDPLWRLPLFFLVGANACILLLWWAGRRQRIHGAAALLLMAGFVSIPTAYFLAAEVFHPGGAAVYINGSIAYAYLPMIAVTGLVHDFRVSFTCGIVAALGYLGCFLLARPDLLAISAPTAEMHRILTSGFVAAMKALVIAGTGMIVGAVSLVSRGLLLRTLEEERQREAVQRLFGQYVGGVVSERILERAAESRGERVEVAVLFSDLRGFSTFAEGRDPAEVVERLNAYFERMVDAITREGGVVDKFIGDAVMAIFGGLVALDNASESAVRAAIAMREELAQLNTEWTAQGLEPFENGIGIHVGQVLQGPIGSRERKEFTAIGDAVNSASRLEALTKDNDTPLLVTAAVFDRLPADLRQRFGALGDVSVKGKREMLVIYGLGIERDL